MPRPVTRSHRAEPHRPKGRVLLFLGVLLLSSALMYGEVALRFSP